MRVYFSFDYKGGKAYLGMKEQPLMMDMQVTDIGGLLDFSCRWNSIIMNWWHICRTTRSFLMMRSLHHLLSLLSRCLCSVLISSRQSFPSAMNQKRRMCLSTLRKSFCLMQRPEHWLEDSCGCKARLKTKIIRGCTTN